MVHCYNLDVANVDFAVLLWTQTIQGFLITLQMILIIKTTVYNKTQGVYCHVRVAFVDSTMERESQENEDIFLWPHSISRTHGS